MIKAYAINSKYGGNVRIIYLELEERKNTYKVLKSGIAFYGSIIKKQAINQYDSGYEQVICFDLQEGMKIYKTGISETMKKEEELFLRRKNRFNNLLEQLNEK